MYWILKNWKIDLQVVTPSLFSVAFPLCPPLRVAMQHYYSSAGSATCSSGSCCSLPTHIAQWIWLRTDVIDQCSCSSWIHTQLCVTFRDLVAYGSSFHGSRTTHFAPLLHDPCTYGSQRPRAIVSSDTMSLLASNLRCIQHPVSSTASFHRV